MKSPFRLALTAFLLAPAALPGVGPEDPLLVAVLGSPAVSAARLRIGAARERVGAAGRLADPEIEAMASRVSAVDNGEMWELTVRQPLPRKGERQADRSRAGVAVSMAEAELAVMAAGLAGDVARLLAEAEGAAARVSLFEAQRERTEAVLEAQAARLASASNARLSDRLTLQGRAATLELMLEQARRQSAETQSVARGRLSLPPKAPLPAFSAPEPTEVAPGQTGGSALLDARAAEADAEARLARARANPQTAVGLRLERERGGMGDQDIVGLAFSSDIPWRSRRYARVEAKAAEADRDAARAEGSGPRQDVAAALAQVELADRAAAVARQVGDRVRLRLEAEHQTLVRATAAGPGSMGESTVLHAADVLDKTTETQLQIIAAETAARVARAEFWRHVPAAWFTGAPRAP